MSALAHPSNHAAMSHQRALRLASAPHRESYGCGFCGASWLVSIGRNRLPMDEASVFCARCGQVGEP